MTVELTHQPLDPERITTQVRQDTNGAVVTFLGTTRNNFEGKRVIKLEYEAFEEMALKKMGANLTTYFILAYMSSDLLNGK